MTEARPRPSQATVATVLGAVGAALFVVGLFDFLAVLRSVEFRTDAQDYLAKHSQLDFTVDRVVDIFRVGVFAAGVIAAIAFVFAIYLRQGHKGARIGFTVAAVLLFPGIRVSADLFLGSFLLVLAVVWLWSRPVRDWYAGREPQQAVGASTWDSVPAQPPTQEPPRPPVGPIETARLPPPYVAPPAYVLPPPAYANRRPPGVIWAAVLTWFCSGLVGVVSLLAVIVVGADRSSVIGDVQDEVDSNSALQDMGITANQVLDAVLVLGVMVVVWCLVSSVLALLTVLGINWARILLAISAAASALLSLVAILAFAPVFTLSAAIIVIVLLFNGRTTAWFNQRNLGQRTVAPAVQPRPPRRPW